MEETSQYGGDIYIYILEGPNNFDGNIFTCRNVFSHILTQKISPVKSYLLQMKNRPTPKPFKFASLAQSGGSPAILKTTKEDKRFIDTHIYEFLNIKLLELVYIYMILCMKNA